MIILKNDSNHKFINCPKIYDDITKDIDITEHKIFYIFYSCEDRNTLSYIKSMNKLLKYNIEIVVINLLNTLDQDLVEIIKEINKNNSKYIILKSEDEDLNEELMQELKESNNVDKNNTLTVNTVCYILEQELKLKPQRCIIIGRHLGFDIAEKLTKKLDYSPQIVHSQTENIIEEIKRYDLIISTAGSKDLITDDMVNENSIVIDVGLGDIEASACNKCLAVTPKINGVGLVTTAMLIKAIRS